MKTTIDQLGYIQDLVPALKERLDHSRIAVAGHSMGGHTASMLLGARLTDPADGAVVNMIEPRIKAESCWLHLEMGARASARSQLRTTPSSGTPALQK